MSKQEETPGGDGQRRAARRWGLEPPGPPPDPNGYGANRLADHAYFAEPARPEPRETRAEPDSPWTEERAEQWVSELLKSKQRLRAQDETLPIGPQPPAESATRGERLEPEPEAPSPPRPAETEEIGLETNDHPGPAPALHYAEDNVPAPSEEETHLETVSAASRRERPEAKTFVRSKRALAAVVVVACAAVLVTIIEQPAPHRTASSPGAPLLQAASITSILTPLQTLTSERSFATSPPTSARHIQRAQRKPGKARQGHTPATQTDHGPAGDTTASTNNAATATAASNNPVSTSRSTSSPTTYTGTPVTQSAATQAPAPAASTGSSPPASTGSSPSSSASSTSHSTSQSATPAKQPAFGAQGVLGPGTSPNS